MKLNLEQFRYTHNEVESLISDGYSIESIKTEKHSKVYNLLHSRNNNRIQVLMFFHAQTVLIMKNGKIVKTACFHENS